MEYFYHFLKFLGVFALIVALALFGMQAVAGTIAAGSVFASPYLLG